MAPPRWVSLQTPTLSAVAMHGLFAPAPTNFPMLTLHLNATTENTPRAVVAIYKILNGEPNFQEDHLSGDWYRVFPATARDVQFLQMLEHRVDKFAPASGGGVLVHPRVLTVKTN